MEPETKVLRSIVEGDGYEFQAWQLGRTLPHWDIVAGNRYSMDDGGIRLIPDPDGPWLALVTHRGEFAPPRPKTLPVGAKVRRGPDWCWGEQDGERGALGTVKMIGHEGWAHVAWPHGGSDCYRFGVMPKDRGGWDGEVYDLEIVSIPEPTPAPAPPIVERERARLEAAKSSQDDGTAARVIEEGLREAKADVLRKIASEGEHRPVSNMAPTPYPAEDAAAYIAAIRRIIESSWDDMYRRDGEPRPQTVGTYGISAHEAGQRPATGAMPDMIPAAVLARRASQPRRVYVPTETIDDMAHLLVDAEPECGIVVRKAVS